MTQERLSVCPECQAPVFFSPDGRSQQCEVCGYKQAFNFQTEKSILELEKAIEFLGVSRQSFPKDSSIDDEMSSARRIHRDMLAQGISAVKQKKMDEAFYYLAKILKTPNTHQEERLSAWMWLSAVADNDKERRICLVNVLAIQPGHPTARRGLAILEGRLKQSDIIDPEQIYNQNGYQDTDMEPAPVSVKQMTCPQCNGRMNFNPENQLLQCDFCQYQIQPDGRDPSLIDEGNAVDEQDFIVALATIKGHRKPERMRVFQCGSCAVEFILAPETISVTCPYCDSVYVVETIESDELVPPQGVIPFTVSQEEAEKALRAWFHKKRIDRPRISPIVGTYIPVWTFDISGPLKWSCLVKQGDNWVRKTGEDHTFFDDFLIPATIKLPEPLTDRFDKFDLSALVPYVDGYLADFPAERYQISLSNASLAARAGVMEKLRKRPERMVKTSNYRNFNLSAVGGLNVQSYKLILVPLWITHYQLDDEIHDVTINGQTTAVYGARPRGVVGRLVSWLLR